MTTTGTARRWATLIRYPVAGFLALVAVGGVLHGDLFDAALPALLAVAFVTNTPTAFAAVAGWYALAFAAAAMSGAWVYATGAAVVAALYLWTVTETRR